MTTSSPRPTEIAERRHVVDADWALGPGAVSWKVMRDPTVFIIGILREATLLTLHLPFAAAAADHDRVNEDPAHRFRTIARYFYCTIYGSNAEAERVSSRVRGRHVAVTGIEPVTGLPYHANSDYELALTHVLQTFCYLTVYETLHGRLPGRQRDQYVLETKAAAGLVGIRPDYLPSTFDELEVFLAKARTSWAGGRQARTILKPFATGEYPPGSKLGDLPTVKRRAVGWVVQALTDMAVSTMGPEERDLLAIDRRPQLRSRAAVRLSLIGLSMYMSRPKGRAAFERFLQPDVADIVRRAFEAEDAAGGHEVAAATFAVPADKNLRVAPLRDHVENMPDLTVSQRPGEPSAGGSPSIPASGE